MAATATLNLTLVYATDPVISVSHRAVRGGIGPTSLGPGRADNPRQALELLINELRRLQQGNEVGKVLMYLDKGDGTAGIGRLACASVANGDTATVAGVVFTAKTVITSTVPSDGQFLRGVSDTADALALATAINAHPLLAGLLTAAGSVANCNVTLTDAGLHGNFLVMSSTGGNITVTQVSALTPGVHGTSQDELRCYRRGI